MNRRCYCGLPLIQYEKNYEELRCLMCTKRVKNMEYFCKREDCIFKSIIGYPYGICTKCHQNTGTDDEDVKNDAAGIENAGGGSSLILNCGTKSSSCLVLMTLFSIFSVYSYTCLVFFIHTLKYT